MAFLRFWAGARRFPVNHRSKCVEVWPLFPSMFLRNCKFMCTCGFFLMPACVSTCPLCLCGIPAYCSRSGPQTGSIGRTGSLRNPASQAPSKTWIGICILWLSCTLKFDKPGILTCLEMPGEHTLYIGERVRAEQMGASAFQRGRILGTLGCVSVHERDVSLIQRGEHFPRAM